MVACPLFAAETAATKNQGISACPTQNTSAPQDNEVRIALVGDIVLGNSFLVKDIPKSWEDRYFSAVRPTFKRANLLIGNLEGALTNVDKTLKNAGSGTQFAFKMPPSYAKLLANEGFGVLHVANNHAQDFGDNGFADTLDNLKQTGIAIAGRYQQYPVVSAGKLKVAVIGATYSPASAQVFNSIFDQPAVVAQVRQAKADGAYVIVTFHAGAEGTPAIWHDDRDEPFLGENRGNTVAFAHAMIEAGADLVAGHGPHVLRAVECYMGRPIAYSLGNFVAVGGLSIKQMANVSAILQMTISPDGVLRQIEMLPVRFDDARVPLPDNRGFALHLLNQLGRHARYPGTFVEFPAPEESKKAFDVWFAENAPK